MSDRLISIAQVYMAMYSNEITWAATGILCFALGAWLFYEYGKERGDTEGLNRGYERGYESGLMVGRRQAESKQPKRDAKGRFVSRKSIYDVEYHHYAFNSGSMEKVKHWGP